MFNIGVWDGIALLFFWEINQETSGWWTRVSERSSDLLLYSEVWIPIVTGYEVSSDAIRYLLAGMSSIFSPSDLVHPGSSQSGAYFQD